MQQTDIVPYSSEAENGVIGSILIDESAIIDTSDIIQPEDFYHTRNRDIYRQTLDLFQKGHSIDILVIGEALPGETYENIEYLMGYINLVPTSVNAISYARIVAEKAKRRRMIQAASQIAKAAYEQDKDIDEQIATAEASLLQLRGDSDRQSVLKPRVYTSNYFDRFNESRERGSGLPGLSCLWTDLNSMIDGFQAPHQYIIAARPKMGKSALVLNIIADMVLNKKKKIALFSLEMSETQVINRIVASMTKIPLEKIGKPWLLKDNEATAVYRLIAKLSDSSLFIDPTPGITPGQVRSRCMRLYAEHGLDMIVIDHLHIMRPDRQMARPDMEFGDMTMTLARLYKELNVPGITVAQLNRGVESRGVKRPLLSDLRESGRIEENAYGIMFLYRPGYYDETEPQHETELIVAANRDGKTGTVKLHWRGEIVRFENAAREINLL